MRSLWRVIRDVLFWSYDRGTWQYDLLVVAIVAFVFLTPRAWFRDQPVIGPPGHSVGVELVELDAAAGTTTYRIDAHLLALPTRTPELQRKTHDILSKHVDDLKGRTFQVLRIEPALGEDGAVLYYDVSIK